MDETILNFNKEPEKKENIESNPDITSILDANERERLTLREVLVANGQEELVKAIENAVDNAATEVVKLSIEPIIELPVTKKAEEPKNIIPATLALGENDGVSLSKRIEELMAGRLESDIPMTDDYWKLKNMAMLKGK